MLREVKNENQLVLYTAHIIMSNALFTVQSQIKHYLQKVFYS